MTRLDENKSAGYDGVHPIVLKRCAGAFAKPLFLLFRKSFDCSAIPEMWSKANVTPLFKKGSRIDPTNYRPVSLTSVICKLLEGIVRDRIMAHLYKHNLIVDRQHGSVENKDCTPNLLETQDLLTKAIRDQATDGHNFP